MVIIHIDSYITVFVLYTDAHTHKHTHKHVLKASGILAVRHLIFEISPSFSLSICLLTYFPSLLLPLFPPAHLSLPMVLASLSPLSSVLPGARVTCVDLLSNLPGLSVIPQQ